MYSRRLLAIRKTRRRFRERGKRKTKYSRCAVTTRVTVLFRTKIVGEQFRVETFRRSEKP